MTNQFTDRDQQRTRSLLNCGIAAGPLLLAVWAVQAVTRDGFDPTRHPMSLLAVGAHGWVQIANFVVTGALVLASAVGIRRTIRGRPGGTNGPRLMATFGVGLILAGIFVADAGAGFPKGAPEGKPEMSWHGALHEVGFGIAQFSWIAACLVIRRYFLSADQRRAAKGCVIAVVVALLIVAFPHLDSFSMRVVIATAVEFIFVASLAVHLRSISATTRHEHAPVAEQFAGAR